MPVRAAEMLILHDHRPSPFPCPHLLVRSIVYRGERTTFLTGRVARFLFRRPRGRRGQTPATFGRQPSDVRGIVRVRGRAGQGGRRCRRSGTARTFVGLSRLRGRRGHGRARRGHVVGRRQPGDQRFGRGLEVGNLVVVVVVMAVRVAAAAAASFPSCPRSAHRLAVVTVLAADI